MTEKRHWRQIPLPSLRSYLLDPLKGFDPLLSHLIIICLHLSLVLLWFPDYVRLRDLDLKMAWMNHSRHVVISILCSSCLRRQASSVLSHWIPAKNMPEWRLCGISAVVGRFVSVRYKRQCRVSGTAMDLTPNTSGIAKLPAPRDLAWLSCSGSDFIWQSPPSTR